MACKRTKYKQLGVLPGPQALSFLKAPSSLQPNSPVLPYAVVETRPLWDGLASVWPS